MPSPAEPSSELDAAGRKLYYRIKGWIKGEADWTESDQLLLNQACIYEQRARHARKAFKDEGNRFTVIGSTGSPVVNPISRVGDGAEAKYVDALRELGLTPKARTQMNLEPKPTGDDPLADAFA